MNDKGSLILNRDTVANTKAEQLLGCIQSWILRARPTCLVHPLGFCVVLLQRTITKNGVFMCGRKVGDKLGGFRRGYTHTIK